MILGTDIEEITPQPANTTTSKGTPSVSQRQTQTPNVEKPQEKTPAPNKEVTGSAKKNDAFQTIGTVGTEEENGP